MHDLHLSSEEFYALTPRQFDALLERHKAQTVSNEFLLAQLTSWIANTGFRSTEKPTKPQDFMPSEWAKSPQTAATGKRKRMTRKRRQALAMGIAAMFPPLPPGTK